jgi:hypothetical protein
MVGRSAIGSGIISGAVLALERAATLCLGDFWVTSERGDFAGIPEDAPSGALGLFPFLSAAESRGVVFFVDVVVVEVVVADEVAGRVLAEETLGIGIEVEGRAVDGWGVRAGAGVVVAVEGRGEISIGEEESADESEAAVPGGLEPAPAEGAFAGFLLAADEGFETPLAGLAGLSDFEDFVDTLVVVVFVPDLVSFVALSVDVVVEEVVDPVVFLVVVDVVEVVDLAVLGLEVAGLVVGSFVTLGVAGGLGVLGVLGVWGTVVDALDFAGAFALGVGGGLGVFGVLGVWGTVVDALDFADAAFGASVDFEAGALIFVVLEEVGRSVASALVVVLVAPSPEATFFTDADFFMLLTV